MQLTPKEASLLKDLKGQEQLCVDKYNRHAASANDPQLKNLFEQIAQVEQQHLDAITQMEGGTVAAPADSATVPTTFFMPPLASVPASSVFIGPSAWADGNAIKPAMTETRANLGKERNGLTKPPEKGTGRMERG